MASPTNRGDATDVEPLIADAGESYRAAPEDIAASAPVTVDGVNYIRTGHDRPIAALGVKE